MKTWRRLALGAGAVLAACQPSSPPPAADSATPPEDSVVYTAPVVEQQAQVSRIGRFAMLGEPMSGSCSSEGDPLVATRFTYEGDWPMRRVRVEVPDTASASQPSMLEVEVQQRVAAYGETETIYVLFSANGAIERGTRRYFTDETPPTREESPLLPSDSAQVTTLASQILAFCRGQRR